MSRDSVATNQDETQGAVEVRKPYRWTTGRNRTITIRASDETINLFDKLAVATCNQNWLGLQSADFWDHISCNCRPLRDHIICKRKDLVYAVINLFKTDGLPIELRANEAILSR